MNHKLTKNTNTNTKQRIIDCFWELFHQKSIDKITVSEITTHLQINRSTFYVYFKDVYDVLEQIEESYLPKVDDLCHQFHNIQDKEFVYQTFLKLFDNNYENLIFLLSDQGDPNFIVRLKKHARPIFKNAMPEPYSSSKYFDLTLEFLLSASIDVITYWANHPSQVTSDELFNHLHNLFIFGIKKTHNDLLNEEQCN